MKWAHILAWIAGVLVSLPSAEAVTIDMVPVRNAGNTADTRYSAVGFGSVGYAYQIGKFEVTAGQYTEFLNAVAKNDPYGLYNGEMAHDALGANIVRNGSSPNQSYTVAADWANRPVNYVSFWDAVRFVNWLHNGQPMGAEGPGTTEDGAYHDVDDQHLFGRNLGAKFFIPTDNEWYKAAYHKNDGTTGNYWDYPTSSNTAPINTVPDPGNHGNFYDVHGTGNNNFTIGSPYYRTEVGAFGNSSSPYGTFDQGGNVFEWTETVSNTASNIVRGGSFAYYEDLSRASFSSDSIQTIEANNIGFRVASIVPEPSALLLSSFGAACLYVRRRKFPVRN